MNTQTLPQSTTTTSTGGVLLQSVDSWIDIEGIHPLRPNGIPDLNKNMTVDFSEIEFVEFAALMTSEDVILYKLALSQFAPTAKQTRVWVDEVWRETL
jgi:hypothetical protein